MGRGDRSANQSPIKVSWLEQLALWATTAPLLVYLGASAVSLFGDSLFEMAVVWHIMSATGSASTVGGIAAAIQLPVVLSGAFAGVLADRWSRKRLIVLSTLARGGVIAAVLLFFRLGLLTPWHLMVVGMVDSFIQVLGGAAGAAVVPNLVDQDRVIKANAWFRGLSELAPIAAQASAGVIIAVVGIAGAAGITSTLFLISAGLFFLIPAFRYGGGYGSRRRLNVRVFFGEFADGLGYTLRRSAIRWLMFIGLSANLLVSGPIFVLMPFYSTVLGVGAPGYGYMKTGLTVGTLIGAMIVGRFGNKLRPGTWVGMGISLIGALFALLAFPSHLTVACTLWAGIGVSLVIVNIPIMTALQLSVPDERRARTMSVVMALSGASTPASMALVGPTADLLGITRTFLVAGVMVAVLGVVVWMRRTRLEPQAASSSMESMS